ncbi:uncharacterized protein [Littorina saxatilis]|uniref:uncharacterized protein n=1 Tax=Littorina saxatilis TaxID=31220 RepID=UPI0038B4D67B
MARLLFLCVISATTHLCESRSSHCSAGIFTAGKDAFVDCVFSPDESISNNHIYVMWSPSNDNNKEKDVLTCWTHHNDESSCTLAEGYYYDGGISNHIRLLIPDVTPRFSGVYSCMLSMNNYSLSNFSACSLTVKEPEDTKSFSTLEITLFVVCSLLVIALIVIVIVIVLCLPLTIISICPDLCCKCLAGGSHHKDAQMPENRPPDSSNNSRNWVAGGVEVENFAD